MRFKILFLTLFNILLMKQSSALTCYTCSVSENDADTTCADNVTSMPSDSGSITDCDKKFCTIVRVEYLDPKGKLQSFGRSCMDVVPVDGVYEDSTYRTYQWSCKTDLCNSGNGKTSINDGSRSLGDKSTIYAPGTGRSSAEEVAGRLLLVLSCFLLMKIN
ncbi:uncharacterized protein LOC126744215 [Anthonomus grandis grandis]|uniref:uncharacterized protein LOC126744215 n=1 Tax=Anthonomus grandis grandis TaxID=2921223 RepID=UPI0021655ABD|nr:uncharacterized protein LOC126744215 [Anthonomus grandis grandis]